MKYYYNYYTIMDLESTYVKDVYNEIAQAFNITRYNHWPSVVNFINSFEQNSLLLDSGCGNGKNMEIRKDINIVGCDISEELIKICKNKNLNVLLANIKKLPFNNNIFDGILCIAVIHHIDKFDDRLNTINELIRVLKPNKKLLIQVWAKEQKLTEKFIPINDQNDFFVTWKKDSITKRFYHLFTEQEVDNMLNKLQNIKIISKTFEADNWSIIIEKISLFEYISK